MNAPALEHLRSARRLVVGYAALSLATLIAVYLLRNHADVVTDAVWVRTSIVAATSLLMLLFAGSAIRGNPRGLLRWRIVSAIMLVAIVVIVALPGAFPVWLRVEQAVCGVLLLGVVVQVNRRTSGSAVAVR